VVLLDEPFSNLDVEVRERLRSELPAVLAACGACALLVTHDPQEALAVADKVAILNQGLLEQCASPIDLVQRPATAFVGRFVLQANLLPASLQAGELVTSLGIIPDSQWRWCGYSQQSNNAHQAGEPLAAQRLLSQPAADQPLEVMFSQEDLQLQSDPHGDWQLMGREFLGPAWMALLEGRGQRLRLKLPLDHPCELGMQCRVTLRPQAVATLFGSAEAAGRDPMSITICVAAPASRIFATCASIAGPGSIPASSSSPTR
jgi:iron(III) transport system ATP-binding protein